MLRGDVDLADIRRLIVVAIASDDVLMERLVLKGGNALELVHGIGDRASLDLDFSMEDDFNDLSDVSRRLFQALRDRFDSAGFVLFDENLAPRPTVPAVPGARWGGYLAEFKIIPRERARALGGKLESMRREAQVSGPAQRRKFAIDISKFEYCTGKEKAVVDGYECFVYSPAMIAAEKLRAICQQMPEYTQRVHPAPRPRDFYDIHTVVVRAHVDFSTPDMHELIRLMFVCKDVPLALLGRIGEQREFHRQDWPSVQNAVRVRTKEFDFYVDFVVEQAKKLQPLWVV